MRRRRFLQGLAAGCAGLAAAPTVRALGAAPIVIRNARIFDGVAARLENGSLLIADRQIRRIAAGTIEAPEEAIVIDAGGRVLMPGLSDAHWHTTLAANSFANLNAADPGLMFANSVAEAQRTLMRGFTSVRDMAGPAFGIKAAIDAGTIPGPRIFPSGAMISQTAGHGDFSEVHARPQTLGGTPARLEELGEFLVANGVPEVLAAVRTQLKKGASQIKLALGGGVVSDFDPIDSLQYTEAEIRAAVDAAADWGTYVAAHVYSTAGIRRAIAAGVRSIEHGNLADEATIRLMAEKGVWLSVQAFEATDTKVSPEMLEKGKALQGTWERVLGWAKQHGTKVAFGTDLLFQPALTAKENEMLTRFARVFGSLGALKIATSGNAELFQLAGPRNPYRQAKLGVVQEGAWADLLIVEGDPTQDIGVLRDYERNLSVIIKDGTIHKMRLG